MKSPKPKILITGAAGRIGSVLAAALHTEYPLRLFDRLPPTRIEGVDSVTGELSDRATLDRAMQGIEVLIHLAAIPTEAPFEELLEPNILGAYAAFESARLAGVRRVLYASSIQAVGFHPMANGVGQHSRIRPSGYYGVTKAFGEALGSLYADKFGLSVACLRIASFEAEPKDRRHLRTWLSHEDCVRLVRSCIEAPAFSFLTVYGVSANRDSVLLDAPPAPLRYQPRDDAEGWRTRIEQGPASEAPATLRFAGGEFCGRGFVGEFGRIKPQG